VTPPDWRCIAFRHVPTRQHVFGRAGERALAVLSMAAARHR